MNKKNWVYVFVILIVVIGIGVYLFLNNSEEKIEYKLKTVALNNCDNRAKVYYDDNTDKIYSYCLESVKVIVNEEEIELSKYLKDEKIMINDFFNKLVVDEQTWPSNLMASDGGTKIYENKKIGLVKCNRMLGEDGFNRDIFIGTPIMEFKSNYCLPNIKTITRTYKTVNVIPNGDFKYDITLSANGETANILYESGLDEIINNKYYEFEFYTNDFDTIEDTIEALFKDTIVVSIRETNKVGSEQIQDPISNMPKNEREALIEKTKKSIFAQELMNYSIMTSSRYASIKVSEGAEVPLCYIVDNYKDGYGYQGCIVMNYEKDTVSSVHVFNDEFYYDGDYNDLVENKDIVINRLTPDLETSSFYIKNGSTDKCPATCIDSTTR